MKPNDTFGTRAGISSGYQCTAFITTIRPSTEEEQAIRAAASESRRERRNSDTQWTRLQALLPSQSKRGLLWVDVGNL
ncbi:hypothetical protein FRC19_008523 [Serendipita sp. 401]|nr:hypothetical protein FRC19_008523 [Serendipita sp. 401]